MSSSFLSVGVVHHAGAWHVTPRTRTHDGSRFSHVALPFASQVFRSDRVVTVRACKGVKPLPQVWQYNRSKLVARCRGDSSEYLLHYTFISKSDQRGCFPARSFAQELEQVDIGKKDWRAVCFIKFLSVRVKSVQEVVSVAPGTPLLAGVGVRNLCVTAQGFVGDDAPAQAAQHGRKLDIAFWFPPKQVDYQQVQSRQARERPIGGYSN